VNAKRKYIGLEDKRILVVEDVEMNQHLARHIMESWGCVVEIAENGSLAVEKVKNADYDLVLMDIQMPVMDGMEATRQIRKMNDAARAGVPIVALTANAMKSECDVYLEIGMNDCMAKPFEEPMLFRTVSKNIKKGKEMNESIATAEIRTETPTGKLYDLSMVEAISGGDRSFITRMLQLFLDTVPATLTDIRNTTDAGEWMALSKHAHKLKSTIDSMNINSLKQDIRSIEAGGKTGDNPELLRDLVTKVLAGMDKVIEQVKKDLR
jgi:CheY-like chemotaxis protein